ncbi:MAG: HAD-IA family hydrolase [Actinomycetota bacterium]|nr:HAD-IA family hydrolase [Actinomycetota bacterium]
MPVKLVIFDLDGTLIDSLEDLSISLNYALAAARLPSVAKDRVRAMIGEGVSRLIEKALPENRQDLKGAVLEKFLEHYSEHLLDHTKPYPGIPELLEKLSGFKKAVISNKRSDFSKKLLEGLGLAGAFDIVIGPDNTSGIKKPAPEPVLRTLAALGVRPAEAVMVGDSLFDIEAGKSAGVLRTIGVLYGYCNGKQTLAGADYLIDGAERLARILYELGPSRAIRKEDRYEIPSRFQNYIRMMIKVKNGPYRQVRLVDLSKSGMRFESPLPLNYDEDVQCLVSIPESISRVVVLMVKAVNETALGTDTWMIGTRIIQVNDELWFRVLRKVFEFMKEREGAMF